MESASERPTDLFSFGGMTAIRFAAIGLAWAVVACSSGDSTDSSNGPLTSGPDGGTGSSKEDAAPPVSQAPLCEANRACSPGPATDASACRESAASTVDIYCCTRTDAQIVAGACIVPTSSSPLCVPGLTCAPTATTGAAACREQAASATDVFCCPKKGDRIVAGVCVPALCGAGLTCASSATTGAAACRQQVSSTTDLFCCPNKGDRIVGGACLPPLCGSGLTCSAAVTTGAPACRQTVSSPTDIYCCPTPGAKIVGGACK